MDGQRRFAVIGTDARLAAAGRAALTLPQPGGWGTGPSMP